MTIGGFFTGGDALRSGSSLPQEAHVIAVFCSRVADGFDAKSNWENVTDRFFMRIEQNDEHIESYKSLVESFGKGRLNSYIGRWIKLHYNLEPLKLMSSPQSRLITAYTSFRKV